jgi:hypothetical protein
MVQFLRERSFRQVVVVIWAGKIFRSLAGQLGICRVVRLRRIRIVRHIERLALNLDWRRIQVPLAPDLHATAADLHPDLRAWILFILNLFLNGLGHAVSHQGASHQSRESHGSNTHSAFPVRPPLAYWYAVPSPVYRAWRSSHPHNHHSPVVAGPPPSDSNCDKAVVKVIVEVIVVMVMIFVIVTGAVAWRHRY